MNTHIHTHTHTHTQSVTVIIIPILSLQFLLLEEKMEEVETPAVVDTGDVDDLVSAFLPPLHSKQ